MENDPRPKQPGEKFMVKELSEKLNKKYGSKLAWNAAEYVKYKEQVESARIDAINGLISAIFQGKVATSGIMMTAKQPEASGKGITMAVLVETYAILSLIVSIMLIFALK